MDPKPFFHLRGRQVSPGEGGFRTAGTWGRNPILPEGSRTKTRQDVAKEFLDAFARRGMGGHFRWLHRQELAYSLEARVDNPGLIDQSETSLCGPSSLLFATASKNPLGYVQFAADLYERGAAHLGKLFIEPGEDLRNYDPPNGVSGIDPADWMLAASIRDSENWFFNLDEVGDQVGGITLPGKLADWFEAAGFRDVRNETNLFAVSASEHNLREANRLYSEDYWVCLFVNAEVLHSYSQTGYSLIPDHWIVLTSPVQFEGRNIRLKVFSWGNGRRDIPEAGLTSSRPLKTSDFLNNYYGYVAAKY